MAQYRVIASVVTVVEGRVPNIGRRELPAFELNSSVQGIVSAEHAAKIARDVVDPFQVARVTIYVCNIGDFSDDWSGVFDSEE